MSQQATVRRHTEEACGGAGTVLRTDAWWEATVPVRVHDATHDKRRSFPTFAEAIAWADREARK